ncbi:uncharacterized protein C1orf232 homolog isoform X4 [Ascaphus truei]|uniref:uncharacterized protein C1orf232 homolog isoform X4 n=1 Tax=Ascaphus truei TaxID=8439 RepID=UPI003F590635
MRERGERRQSRTFGCGCFTANKWPPALRRYSPRRQKLPPLDPSPPPPKSYTAEVIEPDTPDVEDEGLNMSHLARKVQGALGWRSVTSLFSKEEEQRPEQGAEQPSASCPSEATPHERSSSGLWDVFANRWQQSSVEPPEPQGVLAEPPEEHSEAQYPEEMPFKWGFLTSKLAELRGKSD